MQQIKGLVDICKCQCVSDILIHLDFLQDKMNSRMVIAFLHTSIQCVQQAYVIMHGAIKLGSVFLL